MLLNEKLKKTKIPQIKANTVRGTTEIRPIKSKISISLEKFMPVT
jgi:hypothetical protein